MLIKSRNAKLSTRGIYLQDRQLSDTVFQPGTGFREYMINVINRKIIARLSAANEEGEHGFQARHGETGSGHPEQASPGGLPGMRLSAGRYFQ